MAQQHRLILYRFPTVGLRKLQRVTDPRFGKRRFAVTLRDEDLQLSQTKRVGGSLFDEMQEIRKILVLPGASADARHYLLVECRFAFEQFVKTLCQPAA